MTQPDPWTNPPQADTNIRLLPTISADDPPAVVGFLTHTDDCDTGELHLMCPECQEAADAAMCQQCDGTGIYSDEDISCACPYCGATGESGL